MSNTLNRRPLSSQPAKHTSFAKKAMLTAAGLLSLGSTTAATAQSIDSVFLQGDRPSGESWASIPSDRSIQMGIEGGFGSESAFDLESRSAGARLDFGYESPELGCPIARWWSSGRRAARI